LPAGFAAYIREHAGAAQSQDVPDAARDLSEGRPVEFRPLLGRGSWVLIPAYLVTGLAFTAAVIADHLATPRKLTALAVLLLGAAIVTGLAFAGFGWLYYRNARMVLTPDAVRYTNAFGQTVRIPRADVEGLALFMLRLPTSETSKAFFFGRSRRCVMRVSRAFDIEGMAAALGFGVDHGLAVSLSRQEAKRQYPGCLSFFETHYLSLAIAVSVVGALIATLLVTILRHIS
jgi:hypothetical protein